MVSLHKEQDVYFDREDTIAVSTDMVCLEKMKKSSPSRESWFTSSRQQHCISLNTDSAEDGFDRRKAMLNIALLSS